jgi:hypothetical protein
MARKKTIVAGDIKDGVEDWLKAHGAVLDYSLGLCIAELPEEAIVWHSSPPTTWHVTVGFYDKDGNEESTYLDIETAEDDAYETVWKLKED